MSDSLILQDHNPKRKNATLLAVEKATMDAVSKSPIWPPPHKIPDSLKEESMRHCPQCSGPLARAYGLGGWSGVQCGNPQCGYERTITAARVITGAQYLISFSDENTESKR